MVLEEVSCAGRMWMVAVVSLLNDYSGRQRRMRIVNIILLLHAWSAACKSFFRARGSAFLPLNYTFYKYLYLYPGYVRHISLNPEYLSLAIRITCRAYHVVNRANHIL